LALYKKYIDPDYNTWNNFSVEEQSLILKAKQRSNNLLDHTKLVNALPDVEIFEIHEAMERVFQRMRVNLEQDGTWPNNLSKRNK
jgi:hypothetical protein